MYGPVSTQADEEVLAVMVRVHIPERKVWPPSVVNRIVVSGPYDSVAYPVVAVPVYMLVAMGTFYCMVALLESYS
jgi:hypothetical protein